MDELISRQAAIDAMLGDKVEITNVIRALGNERDFEVLNCTCDRHAEIIKALPSVQPTIIHCENCEHWDTSWETVYGLHYCPMIYTATKKNFFCKYGAEKRGEEDG